ncbi:hypothetical protein A1D23_13110 [Chelonobacter oris]|uniref:hypothetical protein n=1 Tax=Chelonobacter oris TaxID=505317 RepID=UPI00244AE218|nr:hypothetical protein [Chelonobacter oris]MDH3001477.1 hypothetical protein [Chelonobacter oris]
MKLARCPVCHSDIHLDQLLEDEAGRDLLRIITETKYEVARPLVSYIALFRPAKSALSNARAVKLMNEVVALYQPSLLLAHALSETVQAVQKKRRDHSNCAPLANHEYLKQVYKSVEPKFGAGSAAVSNAEASESACKRNSEAEERHNVVLYIERMKGLGQDITQLPGYQVWLEYQERKNGTK